MSCSLEPNGIGMGEGAVVQASFLITESYLSTSYLPAGSLLKLCTTIPGGCMVGVGHMVDGGSQQEQC